MFSRQLADILLPSQAAFTPYKESLLREDFKDTKESLYELRDIVAAAIKTGYRHPAANMNQIYGMLQYYEEQRKLLREKQKAARKGKTQVR